MKDNLYLARFKQIFLSKEIVILIFILLLGLFVRVAGLHGNVIFGYDQARDAQRVYDMIHSGNLKLVGPETDIRGLFNGPAFYYLLAIIYDIFSFNPDVTAIIFVLLNLSGIVLLYYLGSILSDKKTGLVAALIWAISYEQANFAKFISNASLMSIASLIFFLGFAILLFRKKTMGLTISVIGLGLATHFNIYLFYLIILYPIYFYLGDIKITKKTFILNILLLVLMLSPFILAELKFKFQGLLSVLQYVHQQNAAINIIPQISTYLDRFAETIYYSIFSFNAFIGLLIFGLCLFFLKKCSTKEKSLSFILIWLFSTIPLFGFKSGVLTISVINASIFGAIILVVSIVISFLLNQKKYHVIGLLFLFIIIISNTNLFIQDNFRNIKRTPTVPILTGDYKSIINYTYQSAGKKDFSICVVTEPLFINTIWSYVYNLYGKSKYGYLPYWSGQQQYLNTNLLPYDTKHVKQRYLIIQPTGGLLKQAVEATIYLEDKVSVLDEEKKIGLVTIQKRHLTNNNSQLIDTQYLDPNILYNIRSIISKDPRYSCFNSY